MLRAINDLFFYYEAYITFATEKSVRKLDQKNVLLLFFAIESVCIESCVLVFQGSLAKPGLGRFHLFPLLSCFEIDDVKFQGNNQVLQQENRCRRMLPGLITLLRFPFTNL